MGAAGTIAAALLIGIWLTGRPAIRTDVLVGWARAWVSSVPDDPKSWRPLGRADMADYPVWRSIRPVPRGWQLISTELSHRTAVYDIAGSGRRGRALLFVANTRRDVRNLPTSPPSQPQHPTGDWLVAAWRSGQRVYILAFEGAPGRYQELVGNASNRVASDNRARSASLTAIDDPPAALFAQIAVAMNDPR
jgi:hypothetical protein